MDDEESYGGWIDSSLPVWSFRGHKLDRNGFATALAHFYRGEINRANVWRQRLDMTTNWAVITTAAVITFAFGVVRPGIHSLIIFNTLLVTLFLLIEARRYRQYELWSYHVRLMETDFYATMLVPPFGPSSDWAESLADILIRPRLPISFFEALGRRLRRNYLWLYLLLGVAWLLKVFLHPTPADSWEMFYSRAALGKVSGQTVMVIGVVLNGLLIAFGLMTLQLHMATGEVLSPAGEDHDPFFGSVLHDMPWLGQSRRRKEYVALVISNEPDRVAAEIMAVMQLGVTRLQGFGMYSGHDRPVMMTVLTVTDIPKIKKLVCQIDPRSFVTIVPAREVIGRRVSPLAQP